MSAQQQGKGLDRRGFLQLSTAALAMTAGTTLSGCSILGTRDSIRSGTVDFRNRLHIPPLAKATLRDGVSVFDLTAQAGRSAIVPGGDAGTWGLNGPLLGPTLRARRGESVRINFTNELDEATALHWHGMHLPAVSDGGPHQMVGPGDTWSPAWTVNQPAATLWYHTGTTHTRMVRPNAMSTGTRRTVHHRRRPRDRPRPSSRLRG